MLFDVHIPIRQFYPFTTALGVSIGVSTLTICTNYFEEEKISTVVFKEIIPLLEASLKFALKILTGVDVFQTPLLHKCCISLMSTLLRLTGRRPQSDNLEHIFTQVFLFHN